jgi:hypothetical protein
VPVCSQKSADHLNQQLAFSIVASRATAVACYNGEFVTEFFLSFLTAVGVSFAVELT